MRASLAPGPQSGPERPSSGRWHARYALLAPAGLAAPWWPLAVLVAGAALSLIARPVIAGLDTPVLAAAWELYREKLGAASSAASLPPLAPWLIALTWSMLGPASAWAWALSTVAAVASLAILRPLGRRLWPERSDIGPLASWCFVGMAGVALSATAVGPGPLAMALLAAALLGLAIAGMGRGMGWLLFGAALGAMVMTIGTPAVASLAPLALLGPLWARQRPGLGWPGWYLGLAGAVAIAAAVLAAASLVAGGPAPAGADLFLNWPGAGLRPSPMPLLMLAAFLYPWPFWPRFWRAAGRQFDLADDRSLRFCLIAVAAPVAALALAGEVHWRSLLLIAPPAALVIARLLSGQRPGRADYHAVLPGLLLVVLALIPIAINIVPWAQLESRARQLAQLDLLPLWLSAVGVAGSLTLLGGVFLLVQATPRHMLSRAIQVALLPVLLAAAVNIEMLASLKGAFNLSPIAARIARIQAEGGAVAMLGLSAGTYAYPGRLQEPLTPLATPEAALNWAASHPEGVIVAPFRGSVLHLPVQPLFVAPQGAGWVALWPAATVMESRGRVLGPRF